MQYSSGVRLKQYSLAHLWTTKRLSAQKLHEIALHNPNEQRTLYGALCHSQSSDMGVYSAGHWMVVGVD